MFSNTWAQSDSSDYEDESFSWLKPSDNEKSRLGIIMGLQLSTMLGNALPNNKLRMGLLGGGYGRINFRKTWSFQQEFYVSVRGSNFKAGNGDISAIKLLYLDAPLILFKQLKRNSPHKIGLGISYAHLINAALFIDNKSYPTGNQPSFNKNDWMPMLAYQYQLEFFAIQTKMKYGYRNLNLGVPWPDNAKPINNNGNINNLTFELSFIF
ncbi:MAG: hypothetical protein SGJ00_12420 [bacterium]|nr:hypothetical protein [bacterium]